MDKSKLGTFEAIAIILTIISTHMILGMPKAIISSTKSSALLNIIYISIIAILLAYAIYLLLKNFPGFDILDIANFLGGKLLKIFVGVALLIYFIFISSVMLRNFSYALQTIYYPLTDLVFLLLLFILAVGIISNLELSSVSRTNLLIVPIVFFSIIFLFIANMKNFTFERIFPILGNGVNSTFITGLGNLFAFGGIEFLFLLPPLLKNHSSLKTVSLTSIALSSLYIFLSVSTILLMFSSFLDTNELMPLYTAVRYIEFGTFFQRLDSLFLFIWIISVCCYISIMLKFSINIFKKLVNIKSTKMIVYPFTLILFGLTLIPKNIAISTFLETTVYKYIFFIVVIGICLPILIFANIRKVVSHRHRLK